MKATLVYPPIPNVTTSIVPPMGLAYLASILLKKRAEVRIVSSNAEGLDVGSTIAKILGLSPDILGISISTPTVNNSLRIIDNVRRENNNIRIIVGGPHPTLFPDEFLNNSVDVVVRGEGELTLSELYDHFCQKLAIEDITGISYKRGRDIVHSQDRELIDDLDLLPFPSWELFPIKKYRSDFRKKKFSLSVISSRGCPAQCTFCYKGIFGDVFRARKPEHIVDEIEYLRDKFHIDEFAILDDSFTSKPKRAMEVCDLLISKKVNLPWTLPSGIRVPTVSLELLRRFKASGCYRIGLGIESGDQQILNTIKKGITLEQARRAVRLLRQVGILSSGYFMIGNLEETEETINKTINFAIELDPDYAQFTKATPYPGTAMYETLKKENNIIPGSWDNYDSFLKSRPLFIHKNLTSEIIDNKLREAYKKYYYRPKCILNHIKELRSIREIVNFLKNSLKFVKAYSV